MVVYLQGLDGFLKYFLVIEPEQEKLRERQTDREREREREREGGGGGGIRKELTEERHLTTTQTQIAPVVLITGGFLKLKFAVTCYLHSCFAK